MLKRANILLGLAILLATAPVFAPRVLAQRGGMGMGMMPPSMMGTWNPVVGSGATYELVQKDGKKQTISIAVVNKDDSGGYWMEYLINTSDNQQMVMQTLLVKDGASMSVSKMVIQPAGRGPMEMSGQMMQMMASRGGAAAPSAPKADFTEGAEKVGSESVTTPAGTFDTMHWRNKDGGQVWLSPKAGPWSFVKSVTPDGTSMTLVKVITDAKSHIVGTPQSMDSMMGGARGRGQN
jgi:hypothetical protein